MAFKVITFSVKSILIINFSFYQWAKINKKNITHMLLCKKVTTIIVKKYDALIRHSAEYAVYKGKVTHVTLFTHSNFQNKLLANTLDNHSQKHVKRHQNGLS